MRLTDHDVSLESPQDFGRLLNALNQARERGPFTRDRAYREIAEEVGYCLLAHPDWIAPYVDELVHAGVGREMPPQVTCRLMQHASEKMVVELIDRGRAKPLDRNIWWLLFASRQPHALEEIGRRAAVDPLLRGDARKAGLHVANGEPAVPRYSLRQFALYCRAADQLGSAGGVFGMPLADVVAPGEKRIRFHYLSVEPAVLPELSLWPGRAHLVGIRSWSVWTLRADADAGGRLKVWDIALSEDRSLDSRGFLKYLDESAAADQPRGNIELVPYDAAQTWEGTDLLDAPDGALGGPPFALEDPPDCPHCGRLMFHVAHLMQSPRDYGYGRRSLFVCGDCRSTGVLATMFN